MCFQQELALSVHPWLLIKECGVSFIGVPVSVFSKSAPSGQTLTVLTVGFTYLMSVEYLGSSNSSPFHTEKPHYCCSIGSKVLSSCSHRAKKLQREN